MAIALLALYKTTSMNTIDINEHLKNILLVIIGFNYNKYIC